MKVWLVTTGTGSPGDEWALKSIHATQEGATRARDEYEKPRFRSDGTSYVLYSDIEEWDVRE